MIESAPKMSNLWVGKQHEQAPQQPNRRPNFAAIRRFLWRGTVETSEKLISAIDEMEFHSFHPLSELSGALLEVRSTQSG
jgi:hypothetical protein